MAASPGRSSPRSLNHPPPLPTLAEEAARLEQNLRGQLEGHRRLLACIGQCREALRRADLDEITSVCEQEHSLAHQLGELEKARLGLIGTITERLSPRAERPLTVGQIAAAVEEHAGRRLAAIAAELRGLVDEVRRGSAVLRGAAEALSRHMAGLMQSVHCALGRARVYGRRGRLVSGDHGQFCVDVRT